MEGGGVSRSGGMGGAKSVGLQAAAKRFDVEKAVLNLLGDHDKSKPINLQIVCVHVSMSSVHVCEHV